MTINGRLKVSLESYIIVKMKVSVVHSPAPGEQTLKDGATLVILDGNNKLIGMHHIVLIDAGAHLKATEFTGIAASNAAATNATYGHAIDLFTVLHIVVVHVNPTTFARHLPVVGGISAKGEQAKRSLDWSHSNGPLTSLC